MSPFIMVVLIIYALSIIINVVDNRWNLRGYFYARDGRINKPGILLFFIEFVLFAPIMTIRSTISKIDSKIRSVREQKRLQQERAAQAKREAEIATEFARGTPKQLLPGELERRWAKATDDIQRVKYKGQEQRDFSEWLQQVREGAFLIPQEELDKCPYCYHMAVVTIWGRMERTLIDRITGRNLYATYDAHSLCLYCAEHTSRIVSDESTDIDLFWAR